MINSHLAKDIAIIGYGSIGREYSRILESFSVYGYEIEKSDFTCEQIPNEI